MCLALYLGTASEQPLLDSADLGVEAVDARRASVWQWFTLPQIRFVRAHGTCGCGFPHLISDTTLEWEEWLAPVLAQSDDREADLRSVRAVIELIGRHVRETGLVELYPVADGSEHLAPKGTIELTLDTLVAERFFFTEQFLHRVSA